MRYISTIAIYEQVSFNEGDILNIVKYDINNIMKWFRKKWEWFRDLLKSLKDKIFKPKAKIIEEKIKEAINPKNPITYNAITIDTFLRADSNYSYKDMVKECIDQITLARERITNKIISISNLNKKNVDQSYDWKYVYDNLLSIIQSDGNVSIKSLDGVSDSYTKNNFNDVLSISAIESRIKSIFYTLDDDKKTTSFGTDRDAAIKACNECMEGIKLAISMLDHPEKFIGDISIYEEKVFENTKNDVKNQDAIKCHQLLMNYSIKISQITIAEIRKSLDKVTNECIRILNILNGADADSQATQESTMCNVRIV